MLVRDLPGAHPPRPAAGGALAALAARYQLPLAALDGWQVAVNLTRPGQRLAEPGLRLFAERLAARAVLARAARLVGPLRGATVSVREILREPYGGELDLETTLENLLGKPFPEPGDWVLRRRVERRHQVVLMVDTSLSMSGENMAIAAVAAAVLALKLKPEDLSVVVFEDRARAVSQLEVADPPAEVVRRMLERPCGGATNVAAALELGHAELQRGRNPRRSAVLVSDGIYTAGVDPRPAAARFAALHVLRTHVNSGGVAPDVHLTRAGDAAVPAGGAYRRGFWVSPRRVIAGDVARAGGGRLVDVDSFAALPRRMLDLVDHVLR